MTDDVRLEDLLGRTVRTANNRAVGRLEEVRTEKTPDGLVVTGVVIGVAGLLERLGLGARLIVGARGSRWVARWDQIDVTDPRRPRLTCALEELERI